VAVLVVSAVGAVAALPAQAQAVTCGQVITADTTLEDDLTCWEGFSSLEPAVSIGAPGITLDLGGHKVAGPVAIRNEGYDDVTIENGSVESDNGGVWLTGASGNVVRSITAAGLYGGIRLESTDDSRVVDSSVVGVFFRVNDGSDRNVIARNIVAGYESGISVSDSSDNRLLDNISWTNEDGPLSLYRAHRNVVRGNALVATSRFPALPILSVVESNENRVVKNKVVTYGFSPGSGIELDASNDNLIRLNEITGAPLGVYVLSGVRNELRRNVAVGAPPSSVFDKPFDGFHVADGAEQTLLLRNSASQFEQNGFSLFGAATSAGGNSATDNGAFGIDAAPGTIDLGGNTASGNGAADQCRNIVCG
jgi:parallel beta-helix repeat protein